MGKASRTKVESTRREKIAAARAAERRAEKRRRIFLASGSIVVVVAIVLVFVVVKLTGGKPSTSSGSSVSNGPTGSALTAVVDKVTSVPASTLNAVGAGTGILAKPTTISGSPLTENGKPEMFFMGAEYCPYCAAERWAMIVALSRFGTFTGLATVHSAAANGAGQAEPDPNTPSFTFLNATYSSPYLTFTPREIETNIPDSSNGEYTTLQSLSSSQQALVNKYDGSTGPIPFIDFGNKVMVSGVSYDPGILDGKSWSTIATDLSNPNSSVAKTVDGVANYITAAICKMTGNQPASACTTVVQSLESQI